MQSWQELLERACVFMEPFRGSWTLGGGTVLMIRHGHRPSRDIDIFVTDPQLLPYLSPRLNDAVAATTSDYDEQSNFLKLRYAEGEIDIIVAPSLTGEAPERTVVEGHAVLLDTDAEIIAKKGLYRAESFKPRDVFDLAVVLARSERAPERIGPVLSAKRDVLLRRLDVIEKLGWQDAVAGFAPQPAYATLASDAPAAARSFLRALTP